MRLRFYFNLTVVPGCVEGAILQFANIKINIQVSNHLIGEDGRSFCINPYFA